MKLILPALLLGLSMGAAAQTKPSYADARQVYDGIDKIQYATALWYKKPLQERLRLKREVNALADRAKQLFPDHASQCRAAAVFAASYVGALNDFALVAEGKRQFHEAHELYAPMHHAVSLGEKKAWCYQELEALDPKAKRA